MKEMILTNNSRAWGCDEKGSVLLLIFIFLEREREEADGKRNKQTNNNGRRRERIEMTDRQSEEVYGRS
jgi:hypothetical protein